MTEHLLTVVEVPGGYGYNISADGEPWICQPFDPQAPFINGAGQPYATVDDAQAAAEQAIAEAEPAPEQEAETETEEEPPVIFEPYP